VLHCVTLCCSVLIPSISTHHTRHTVSIFSWCCSVLQRVAVCCSVLQCADPFDKHSSHSSHRINLICVLQCAAVCCSVPISSIKTHHTRHTVSIFSLCLIPAFSVRAKILYLAHVWHIMALANACQAFGVGKHYLAPTPRLGIYGGLLSRARVRVCSHALKHCATAHYCIHSHTHTSHSLSHAHTNTHTHTHTHTHTYIHSHIHTRT